MWLRIDSEFVDHPKLHDLRRSLKTEWTELDADPTFGDAVEVVIRLWRFTAQYAPIDGDITRWIEHLTEYVISKTNGWYVFPDTLVDCGFLDLEEGRYIVHDWYEMNGQHLEKLEAKRAADRERLAEKRKRRRGDVAATPEREESDVALERNENDNGTNTGDSDESPKARKPRRVYPYDQIADAWNRKIVPVRCYWLGREIEERDRVTAETFKLKRFRSWCVNAGDKLEEMLFAIDHLTDEIALGSQWFLIELYPKLIDGWCFGLINYGKIMSGNYRDDTGNSKRALDRVYGADEVTVTAKTTEDAPEVPVKIPKAQNVRHGSGRNISEILPEVLP